MKKKLKVILHHDVNDHVTIERKLTSRQIISKSFFGSLNLILDIFYYVGLGIISIPKLPSLFKRTASNVNWTLDYKKSLSFLLLIVLAISPILFFKTASEGQRLGGRVLGISQEAIGDITNAKEAITNQDYSNAQNNLKTALQQLEKAQAELDQSSLLLQSIVKLSPDSYNTQNVLEAAQLLTESAVLGSDLLTATEGLRFSPEGLTFTDSKVSDVIMLIRDSSIKISDKLSRAEELLAPLDASILPAEYQSVLKDSQNLVSSLSKQTKSLGLLGTIFADLLLGQKQFLVVLQNNNEIRSTGGFVGTIGQGKINNGSIQSLDIRSVYDFDGQINDWINPPLHLQAVNNRLFIRDSNWWSNFPDSAKVLSYSYERAGGETPDLVVAITPEVFIGLLEITGPITLPTYNVTITASNFVEQIQTSTSLYYDKSLNQPKQLLADLYPALMQRLSEVTQSNAIDLLEMLQQNLTKKNIQIYSRDPMIQTQLEKFNWAGKLNSTDRDYLHLSLSNLGGTKTDRLITREVNLNTTIAEDGAVINQVTYKVNNPLPNDPGLANRSLVKVLVPEGSKLLAAGGFYTFDLPTLDSNQQYKDDSYVSGWNDSLEQVEAHKVWTGLESGKTFFAGWVEVAGGSEQTVTFTYLLPYKLHSVDRYSLLLEKQSGLLPYLFTQEVIFAGREKVWDNVNNDQREITNQSNESISWKTVLDKDSFVGLVLKEMQ